MQHLSFLRGASFAAFSLLATTHAFGCSGGYNLYGRYGLLVAGPANGPGAGKYLSGAVFFDGNCNVSATNLNGGINGAVTNTTATGTYTTNADNTISLSLNLAGQSLTQTYILGASRTAFEAVGIETDGSAIATIDLQAQFWWGSYNQRSLVGTYSAVCSGQPGNYSDLNYVTFNGQGQLSGVDAFNNNGFAGDQPYTGQYQVAPDGTFSGTLNGTFSQFSFTGVMDNFTNEIEYTYSATGIGGIVSCVGKR